ncbi:unnamed protein product [Rhizophagus irregularis]|uniref:Pentatricopeptide repeat-containing protein-mitochondrial domain-containing protein n=5 Tax=Rhizophagus irregularis TaxID=588596 RepID=A0A915ZC68_9GLOM|nr:hypothetical protein RirG_100160 [Rhizophagus irregularis DAOM 197198w]GBC23824.1 hypothetical protein RIR_jg23460.t1 [Rhizophagus irregularis DAOM 181602=DAOM 197198]CAB5368736.1 unnamed protein product [Rhizophagus irregularis]
MRGSPVRLFTATSKLKTTEIVSSNDIDTSNINLLRKDSNKIEDTRAEDTREERIFIGNFREEMDKFSERKHWRAILKLCEEVKQSDRKPDISIYNTILRAYIPLGSIKHSFKILEDMKLANVNPNLTTYHYLLRTWSQAPTSEQDPYLREQIFEMIVNDGLQPDLKIYECYIDSLLAGEECERAFEIFDSLKSKNIYPQLELYIAMIRKAISINEPRIALNYLKSLEQNLFYAPTSLYNDVLRICAYEYYADGILYCWDKLKHRGLNLDEGVCIDILYFAGSHGKPDLVVQVIEYLMDVRRLKLEKFHFSPLTRAYVNAGDIKNAMESLNIMRQAGFQVGFFDTSSTGLYSLIRKDKRTIDNAYYCLEELHKEGKIVDVSALNVVIAACSNIGYKRNVDMIRALETYKAAEKLGVQPNVETFSSILLVCLSAKRKDLADQLWKEMLELKIVPSSLAYNRMIAIICTQDDYEEAFAYLEEMKAQNLLPPRSVYERIINKCVRHGDSRAILALEEAENFEYKFPRSFYQDLEDQGFDLGLAKEIIKNQKKNFNQQKISSNVNNSDVMNEFVDIIKSQ